MRLRQLLHGLAAFPAGGSPRGPDPMPVPRAVTNWIEDAEALHGPTFEEWAPEGFDWRAFCADAPRFADELGETWAKATEAAARVRLEELALNERDLCPLNPGDCAPLGVN